MDKDLLFALIIIVLMYVLSQKKVYHLTNRIFSDSLDELDRPTQKGIILHALFGGLLFYAISYLVKSYLDIK
jgi:hypothetical protein